MNLPLSSLMLCLALQSVTEEWNLLLGNGAAAEVTSCLPGWFGTDCRYQCHCNNLHNKCDPKGQCSGSSKCLRGWFGPACQFQDLTINGTVETRTTITQTVADLIADGNDETCYPANMASIHSVSVNWTRPYYFTWMRIVVNDSAVAFLVNFRVEFKNKTDDAPTACPNQRTSKVNNRTLDIHCGLHAAVKRVVLTGEAIQHLCSLYISGGQNVALNQSTDQSTDFGDYRSGAAVDGIRYPPQNAQYCSHTNNLHWTPNWTLNFAKPQLVTRYEIYNRKDPDKSRLKGFVLASYGCDDSLVFQYQDRLNVAQTEYTITSSPVKPVSRLIISVTYLSKSKAYLTLCEVEAYAEPQCTPGHYGIECQSQCNCFIKDEACFFSTGGCPTGCASGSTGEACHEDCPAGTFGQDCAWACSQMCAEQSCNRTQGFCDKGCAAGYKPPLCTQECDSGYYGINCSDVCPTNCKNQACNVSSGACFICNPGYVGEMCNLSCAPNLYGQDCKYNCSEKCLTNETERICNLVDGICLFGCANGSTGVFCQPGYLREEEETSSAATIGLIFGLLFLVILVSAVSVILWRRRGSDSEGLRMAKNNDSNPGLEYIALESIGSAVRGTQQEDKTTDSICNQQGESTTAISMEDLESFMLSNNADYFKNQFQKIPNVSLDASMSVALSVKNKSKNRYKNICVYDHSRVTLTVNKEKNEEDYINASFIEGYKNDEKFIASQAPTKIMIDDFIRMLWEYKVDKVVMLTNLVEDGKSKCEKYWPEDINVVFGGIEVHLATTHVFADYTIRKLKLKKDDQTAHTLTHFHFTSWPDKGVPETPWPLVDFEQRVAACPSHKPTVVHCSAGVGRTGTYIALCNVIREAMDIGQIDFFRTLAKLRTERVQMIQTYEQYIFLHKAAQMAMVCLGTTVSAENIADRIATLELKSANGQTYMEKEFKGICSLTFDNIDASDKEEKRESLSPVYGNIFSSPTEKQRNRFSNIVPKDIHRPVLHCETRAFSNYINAVLVPSFTKLNNQILTQLPLPTTINDFWRLVMQHRVTLIVAFEDDAVGIDSSIGKYLPTTEDKPVCALFDIKAGPATYGSLWVKQDIVIAPISKKMSFRRSLQQEKLDVTHLKMTSTNLEPEILLSLATQIRACRSGDAGKTLYMCRNGAEFSGLAYVTILLLDRMDNDCCLTVPPVVGAIKLVRPEVIPTLEQYKALYTVLKLYTESVSTYTNFGQTRMKPALETSTSLNNHNKNEDFSVYSNS